MSFLLHRADVRPSFITTTVREQRPRSHHKGAIGRVRTGNQRLPVLCHCIIKGRLHDAFAANFSGSRIWLEDAAKHMPR